MKYISILILWLCFVLPCFGQRVVKQSTTYDLRVFMVDSTDHVTGKTGLSGGLTIAAAKSGTNTFSAITPTVTEITTASGWYNLALTTSHTDTVGDTVLHITGTGADPTDTVIVVRANVLGDTLPANATQWAGVATATDDIALKATLAKTTDITGFNDISTAQVNTEADLALSDVGLTTTITDRIDIGIGTRLATAGYTAPDNTTIGTINTKIGTPLNGTLVDDLTNIQTQVQEVYDITVDIQDSTDFFKTMIELDVSVYRFTTNALEQAPSGGGSGLTAQQVRDSLKLAPTAGAPAAGSVDKKLDKIQIDVNTR